MSAAFSARNVVATSVLGIAACIVVSYVAVRAVRLYTRRGKLVPMFALGGATYGAGQGRALGWDGKQVTRLCRTVFILWNVGTRPITKEDLSATDPISLEIEGSVLDVSILATAAKAIAVQHDGSRVQVDFEALSGVPSRQKSRGLSIQIVHDSSEWQPVVSGRIGEYDLTNDEPHGRVVAPKNRSGWVFVTCALGFVGSGIWAWTQKNSAWLHDTYAFSRGVSRSLLLLACTGLIASVIAYYFQHVISYGRSFAPSRADLPDIDRIPIWLWWQRVPYVFRRKVDVGEQGFWRTNADRWSSGPSVSTD